jgi:Immunoglobulin-like domain of bacterial spore germination
MPPLQHQQQIILDAPRPGASVVSPAALRGSTVQFPFDGNLIYRVFDAQGNQIGTGPFRVSGVPGQPATFVASLTFDLPPGGGGMIRVEIFDLDQSNGAILAIAAVDLEVTRPLPPIVRPRPQG